MAVFIRCCLKASRSPTRVIYRGRHIDLTVGQFACSIRDMAKEVGCSEKEIRTSLKHLKMAAMLDTEAETGVMRVTVCNYEAYQSPEAGKNTPQGTVQGTVGAQLGHSRGTQNKKEENLEKGEKRESVSRQRATRLPDAWSPSPDLVADAESFGLTPRQVADQTSRFRDYWHGAPGSRGTKLDWPATYRNWMRRAADEASRQPSRSASGEKADPFMTAVRNLTKRYADESGPSTSFGASIDGDEIPSRTLQ